MHQHFSDGDLMSAVYQLCGAPYFIAGFATVHADDFGGD